MYSALAAVYDAFSDDIDYDRWADEIAAAIDKYSIGAKTVIDLACGTGNITARLAKKGYNLTGIDISEEMLYFAGNKFREIGVNVPLSQQDISDFKIHKRADVLCCACDGVNYLTEDGQIKGFFNSCKRALKKGGVLIFDISSEEKLKNVLGNNDFFDIREDACLFWENKINGNFVEIDLNIFLKEDDGRYIRLCEKQKQRIYSVEDIKSRLNGFDILEIKEVCYDKNKKDKRLQFICRFNEEL